jgi:hypothetical protein
MVVPSVCDIDFKKLSQTIFMYKVLVFYELELQPGNWLVGGGGYNEEAW